MPKALPNYPVTPEGLRQVMQDCGLTRGALAAILGVEPSTVRAWRRGERPPPRYAIVIALLWSALPVTTRVAIHRQVRRRRIRCDPTTEKGRRELDNLRRAREARAARRAAATAG